MREFSDASGRIWVATANEEDTPRHHTRWYMVFHPADTNGATYPLAEVRWQTLATAERTLDTMSEFELRRRLDTALRRAGDAASRT